MKIQNLMIFIAGLFYCLTASAQGPFDKVTADSLILGVDDCSSTGLLDKAIRESGVNVLDPKQAGNISNCDKIGNGRAPFTNGGTLSDFCKKGKEANCYSNNASGYPMLCIAGPRSVALKKYYGDAGNVTEYRARFDGLYVISKDAHGYEKERSWQMDGDGCNPTKANLDNPMSSHDECKSYVKAFTNGGNMWPTDISNDKFCSGKTDADMLGSIYKLHDCMESYPQLFDEMTRAVQTKSQGKQTKSSASGAN